MLLGSSPFNYETVRLAREALGLTQKALSANLGYSQGRLSKIEEGLLQPSASDLSGFSTHLNQPLGFFFLKGERRSASVSFYRKAAGVPMKILNQLEAAMNIRRLKREASAFEKPVELPRIPPSRTSLDPRARGAVVAREVRRQWDLPGGRITNLTKLLEDKGVVIFHCEIV